MFKIHSELIQTLDQYKIKKIHTVIGINEYKIRQISLPKDIDDINTWFDENTSKFLPEGKTPTDFIYSFEELREDEDNKYFIVAFTRRRLIEEIQNLFQTDLSVQSRFILINISPLLFSLNAYNKFSECEKLFIDFTNKNKIVFLLIDKNNNLFSGELYKSQFFNEDENHRESFDLCLKDIYKTINYINKNTVSQVFISSFPENFNLIEISGSQIFGVEKINPVYNAYQFLITSLLIINKFHQSNKSGINFLDINIRMKSIAIVHKQLTQRYILTSGIMLIVCYFMLSIGEHYLLKLAGENQYSIQNSSDQIQLNKLRLENESLKNNLEIINSLKTERKPINPLLFQIAEILNEQSFLTDLNINKMESGWVVVIINGISLSQDYIAETINNLENASGFSEVKLLYTEKIKSVEELADKALKDILKFKITVKYDGS